MNEPSATDLVRSTISQSLQAWKCVRDELKTALAVSDEEVTIQKPATKFILTWMRELKEFQREFGKLFGRQKRPPIADDFTAAVGFSLEQFVAAQGFPGAVLSEKTTHRARGATRPDISVWRGNKLIASVECKTDFGWSRKRWKEKWERRASNLETRHRDCASYLCVLSKKNWNADEFESSPRFGNQWFCITQRGIGKLPLPVADTDILTPVERMFLDIVAKLRSASHSSIESHT